jgi:hypothetical protein
MKKQEILRNLKQYASEDAFKSNHDSCFQFFSLLGGITDRQ